MYQSSKLYRMGISFYSTGVIKNGRKSVAYYYRLSSPVTSEQISKIRKRFPYVETGYGCNEFSPENRHQVLIFPTQAEIKRRGR